MCTAWLGTPTNPKRKATGCGNRSGTQLPKFADRCETPLLCSDHILFCVLWYEVTFPYAAVDGSPRWDTDRPLITCIDLGLHGSNVPQNRALCMNYRGHPLCGCQAMQITSRTRFCCKENTQFAIWRNLQPGYFDALLNWVPDNTLQRNRSERRLEAIENLEDYGNNPGLRWLNTYQVCKHQSTDRILEEGVEDRHMIHVHSFLFNPSERIGLSSYHMGGYERRVSYRSFGMICC